MEVDYKHGKATICKSCGITYYANSEIQPTICLKCIDRRIADLNFIHSSDSQVNEIDLKIPKMNLKPAKKNEATKTEYKVFGFSVINTSDQEFKGISLLNPCKNLNRPNYGLPPEIKTTGNLSDIDYPTILYDLLSDLKRTIKKIAFISIKREHIPDKFEVKYKNVFGDKLDFPFKAIQFKFKKHKIDFFKQEIFKYTHDVDLRVSKHMSLILDLKAKSEILIIFSVEF